MDLALRDRFLALWGKFFGEAELPVVLYFTDEEGRAERVQPPSGHQCVIGVLARARKGLSLCFDRDSVGCLGGKRYLGFSREIMPNFEYFLSCGIPGELEGERYKKTPELVLQTMKNWPLFEAPARFIVFKRWDKLEESDGAEVVIFFAKPDVLSGLFTLANFDEVEPNGVFAPFAAGCATIVQYPYLEKGSERPRGVLGMFDVSARPFVPEQVLSFAAPIEKFARMVGNMEESFLLTSSWEKVKKRLE
ncbi:MAG: DUF169 domain-containing protein [Candidatus Bipolaricaulia bacterium]